MHSLLLSTLAPKQTYNAADTQQQAPHAARSALQLHVPALFRCVWLAGMLVGCAGHKCNNQCLFTVNHSSPRDTTHLLPSHAEKRYGAASPHGSRQNYRCCTTGFVYSTQPYFLTERTYVHRSCLHLHQPCADCKQLHSILCPSQPGLHCIEANTLVCSTQGCPCSATPASINRYLVHSMLLLQPCCPTCSQLISTHRSMQCVNQHAPHPPTRVCDLRAARQHHWTMCLGSSLLRSQAFESANRTAMLVWYAHHKPHMSPARDT